MKVYEVQKTITVGGKQKFTQTRKLQKKYNKYGMKRLMESPIKMAQSEN